MDKPISNDTQLLHHYRHRSSLQRSHHELLAQITPTRLQQQPNLHTKAGQYRALISQISAKIEAYEQRKANRIV